MDVNIRQVPLSAEQCQRARMARDARFDGQFFVAVKSTHVFCRPICPANLPKEENVEYYFDKAQALAAGYRPCLRCRPESAPGSWAWRGTKTTVARACQLIEQGQLSQDSLPQFAERLGVSDRYLRQLFQQQLGMSPKQYALYQQLMFAKQLLHSSTLSITEIGYAAGFHSTRRFNDAFQKQLRLTPTEIRRNTKLSGESNQLLLSYRGQLDWQYMLDFYRQRAILGVEVIDEHRYARFVDIGGEPAWFALSPHSEGKLKLQFELPRSALLPWLVANVRRMFDLDSDCQQIEAHLNQIAPGIVQRTGVRIPGIWSVWEAGVRAVLGQQVSVKAAIAHLNHLVQVLNDQDKTSGMPTPEQVACADLSFLKMPAARKETLKQLALWVTAHGDAEPEQWIAIKGIGPWTVQYAQLRGLSQSNCFLVGDLMVKKRLVDFPQLDQHNVSPWGSYATFHLWSHT